MTAPSEISNEESIDEIIERIINGEISPRMPPWWLKALNEELYASIMADYIDSLGG